MLRGWSLVHGMIGTGASFHSYNTKAIASSAPTVIMPMKGPDDHAYMSPPPDNGIFK